MGGLQTMLLNGKRWEEPVVEKPVVNSVEVWELVNGSGELHPFHIHQVLDPGESQDGHGGGREGSPNNDGGETYKKRCAHGGFLPVSGKCLTNSVPPGVIIFTIVFNGLLRHLNSVRRGRQLLPVAIAHQGCFRPV